MHDLFGGPITWDEAGRKGKTHDGRAVSIEESIVTGRFVAALDIGGGVITRRARRTAEQAKAEIERAAEDAA